MYGKSEIVCQNYARERGRQWTTRNSNRIWSLSTFSVGGRNGNKGLFSMRVGAKHLL